MSFEALDLIEQCSAHASAEAIAADFFTRIEPFGARSNYVRSYVTDSAGRSAPSQTYFRVSPPGWEDAYAREGGDGWNPIARAASLRVRPFRFREIHSDDPRMRVLWDFLESFAIPDGLAIPCHAPGRHVGLYSIGFEDVSALSPRERATIELAAMALHNRMLDLSGVAADAPVLTAREHDCIGFVAEGKSDWEMGVILGISQSTVHRHVENAKRKLGAVTRAQAVARWILSL